MISLRIPVASILFIGLSLCLSCSGPTASDPEVIEAAGVIRRVLPGYADRFILRKIEKADGRDVFEIEAGFRGIIIRGSSGVAICSGFNHYLKNVCHASWNWRCGNNTDLGNGLRTDFSKIRKVSPYKYRYIFNYCTFSYSLAFLDWQDWEKLIDWMALNGINMPLAPSGQELIWQRVYEKLGLSPEDLKDFFVGPVYNAFGRMGCIDSLGGPLPQSWIVNENILQKKILDRERKLGMTPVLQGFTGHIPFALVKKIPDLKFSRLNWIDFPATYLLDSKDPLFETISKDFTGEQMKEYDTDHLYAIDQFIEMQPATGDTSFLRNMSSRIFTSICKADPEGTLVVQTWPFKELGFWNRDRTKAYFDGVPDNRMIALELMGESWQYTGWYKHSGWYGKPWIWSVISNFGDNVNMFGGLPQIADNLGKALESPDRGKLEGLGLMMEGLDYNPVTYQLVTDMMWEGEIPDLKEWEKNYILSRYGMMNDTIASAWENIFDYYYTKSAPFEFNPVIKRPYLLNDDIIPSALAVDAIREMIASSVYLRDNDAYRFDLVNLFRQVFGQYAGHLLYGITTSYRNRDVDAFDSKVSEFTDLALSIETLMGTREEFLFGKWVSDSRKHGSNPEEKKLYERNARTIITTWGGRVLYGYAIKDWAGLYRTYYLPKWSMLFRAMKTEMEGGQKLNYDKFLRDIIAWEDNWVFLHNENLQTKPDGDPVVLANDIWSKYGNRLGQ